MSKTPEQLEQEADALWAEHFGPAGEKSDGSARSDQPADTPVTQPHNESLQPAESAEAQEAADTAETDIPSEPPADAPGVDGVKWEQRYRNAQALMTRATQDAARMRSELANAQRQEAAMLAEIERLRADNAGPKVPPAHQPLPGAGERRDTAPAVLDKKLKRLMEEDPEFAGPLIEQDQSLRRDIDEIRYQMWMREDAAARAAHMAQIFAAHPDVEKLASSPDFSGWANSQPKFLQQVISGGSPEDVIWLLDYYKQQHGGTTNLDAARAAATPNTPRVRRAPIQDRPRFTRAQIKAMPDDEFKRLEQEIDEAMVAGLIY